MIGFFGFVLVVVVGIHLYLWKRLVRDPLRPGPARKIGGLVVLLLAILLPANLILVRAADFKGLAWPGYLWIALMFYLLVTLVVLEIPRLVVSLILRAQDKRRGDARVESRQPVAAAAAATARARHAGGGAEATLRAGETTGTGHQATATDHEPSARGRVDTKDDDWADTQFDDGRTGPDGRGSAGGQRIGPNHDWPNGGEPADGQSIGTEHSGPNGSRNAGGLRIGTKNDEPNGGGNASGQPIGTEHDRPNGSGLPIGAERDGPNGGQRNEAEDGESGRRGIERRLLLARGAAIFAGLTAVGVTGYGVRTALGGPRLDRVQIPLAKLPRAMDGTRLAVVSDIHLGPLTGARHMGRIVEMINSVDADVVCIVGDMVDGSVAELGRLAEPLRDIRSKQGAYFVTGNHEYYSGFQEWVDEVARLGVRPLRNERLEIVTRGGAFELAGVNDLGGADVGDGPDFEAALGDRDKTRPVVLMAHQPIVAHDAARFGVDLQVSGHTHGGQMAPFNYLVKLEQPVVSGYGEVDGVPVYVTNGAGFWGPPVRVGAPPQVTLIELKAP